MPSLQPCLAAASDQTPPHHECLPSSHSPGNLPASYPSSLVAKGLLPSSKWSMPDRDARRPGVAHQTLSQWKGQIQTPPGLSPSTASTHTNTHSPSSWPPAPSLLLFLQPATLPMGNPSLTNITNFCNFSKSNSPPLPHQLHGRRILRARASRPPYHCQG